MVPFWIPIIIRHLIFRLPKKGTIILTTTPMRDSDMMVAPGAPDGHPQQKRVGCRPEGPQSYWDCIGV